MNIEGLYSILYIKKSRAKRHAQFVNRQSSFHEVSYKGVEIDFSSQCAGIILLYFV